MRGPLLVTGGSGYLGRAILASAEPPVVATRLTGPAAPLPGVEWVGLDVRDGDAVASCVERARPRAVIHTAYVQDGPAAWETNVTGSANVARAAAGAGARLVHVSTDVLFDGAKEGGYTEAEEPNPVTDYGRSKADAEREVLAAHPAALVVRTSLMVGAAEPGRQELAVLAAAGAGPATAFFTDELRSPVLVQDLAAALVELADRTESGILHVGGPETVSRYELACLIAAAHGVSPARIRRGQVAGSGLARPANCALDSSRAYRLLRTPIRGVTELGRVAGDPPRP